MGFELQPGEDIIVKCRALMYRGGGWAGWKGWLTLTPTRIVFEANVLGRGTTEVLPVNEIASATLERTLGLIPNRLRVIGRDGRVIDFVTSHRRKIVESIEQVRVR